MDRRNFLKSALVAGAVGIGTAPNAFAHGILRPARTSNPLRILILGGTGFTGPYQVRYAVDRGHKVTIFNRGRSEADLPPGVEVLIGDRNNDLEALRGREWDVVIDNPTTLPVWVRDAASLLKDSADRYIFISTISVYSDNSVPGMDETGPLAEYQGSDPMAETVESLRANMALYGPLKALCEQEAEKWFPGRTTVIRPGLIVGPGDQTDRFTYWPVRVSRGGRVLAPGTPSDPVQIIDARDLAEWTIRMAESGNTGIYNATGPANPLGMGGMLSAIRDGVQPERPVEFAWADAAFLQEHGVSPWSDMPVWIPPIGPTEGFAQVSIRRALENGLTFRPLVHTAADTITWFRTLPAERQAQLRAGLTPEREAEVLTALDAEGR